MNVWTTTLLLATCCLWAEEAESEKMKSTWGESIHFSTKAKEACSMVMNIKEEVTKLRVSCKSGVKAYWCEYQGRPEVCRAYNTNPRHYFIQIMWGLRKLNNACEGPHLLKPQMCKRAPDEAHMVFTTSGSKPVNQKLVKTSQEKKAAQAKAEIPRTATLKPETIRPAQGKPVPVKLELTKSVQAKVEPAKPIQAKSEPPKLTQTKMTLVQPSPVQPEPGKPVVKANTPKKLLPKSPKTTPPRPTETATKDNARTIAEDYCWESLQSICAVVISWFHN